MKRMAEQNHMKRQAERKEVQKPYLTGSALDERTVRNSLIFFGTLIVVFFIAFIACASATFSSFLLRLILNGAAIILTAIIFFNSGSKRGADDVTRGEILWQKKEKAQNISDSEKRLCFHPLKGYVTGLIGTLPFFILALYLALNTSVQMTESGTLPSWMQAYTKRSDIGNALVNYTQPDGMHLLDAVRAIVRITILPFINLIGSSNKHGILIAERLSPLILLIPSVSYGCGYQSGRRIRTQIHTAISENDRKRNRSDKRKRNTERKQAQGKEPEKLN